MSIKLIIMVLGGGVVLLVRMIMTMRRWKKIKNSYIHNGECYGGGEDVDVCVNSVRVRTL